MASDDFQVRFDELRQRAKRGVLTSEEKADYDDLKERFARSLCASQNVHLGPGQRARSSFRVAALYKVEVTIDGAPVKTVTMDVSPGGFSSLLGVPATRGTQVSFKMALSTRDTIAGTAIVASAEKERSGSLYRVSFELTELAEAAATQLEETLFDAILFRKLTPPAAFIVPPRAAPIAPSAEPRRTSSMSMPAVKTSSGPPRTSTDAFVVDAPPLVAAPAPEPPPRERTKSQPERTKSQPELRPLPPALASAPKIVTPPIERAPLDRSRDVDALLDEAMGEMRGESEAARHEKVQMPRAQLASAPLLPDPDATQPAKRKAVFAAAASQRPPRMRGSLALLGSAAAVASLCLAWRMGLLRDPRAANRAIAPTVAAAAPALVADPPSAPVAPIASAVAPVPAPSPTPSAAPSAAPSPAPPPSAEPTSTVGDVNVTASGRRVYIDGRLVGEGPRAFPVACGKHDVRVGSAGATQTVSVPCGGTVDVGLR